MSIFLNNILVNDWQFNIVNGEVSEDVTIIKGVTEIAQATPNAYVDGVTPTALISVTVSDGGSGYSTAPTVAIVGGSGDGGATATATITNGVVTAVTLTNAGSYLTLPKAVFSGGTGSITAKAVVVRNGINNFGAARNTKYEELEVWLLKDATLGLNEINCGTDKITVKRRLDKSAEEMNITAVLDETPAFWRLKVE